MTHQEIPAMAERAWQDPHRPRFHFVSPAGWLNDPNGMGQWNGRYHLFYQYNPYAPVHANIHWGHATSADLVHWDDEPIALAPGPGPDRDGCWSGVLVNDGGVPTLVYSGHAVGIGQRACLAVGDADLRTWTKDPANPVIADKPLGLEITEFRDHCVWRDGDHWCQLVGSGIRGKGGTALLYTSADLRSWELVGPILVGDTEDRDVWTGSVWECVDLFRIGEQAHDTPDVMVVSIWHENATQHSIYYTGRFDGELFEPSEKHHLDFGLGYFYAPQSMNDDQGRRIMFGWMQEGRPMQRRVKAGWAGVMSLPRQVELTTDGVLVQKPAAEVATLRVDHQHVGLTVLAADEPPILTTISGDQLDIEATVIIPAGASFELSFLANPDGSEQTRLILASDPSQAWVDVRLDRTSSSLDRDVDTHELSGSVATDADRLVRVRLLIDHSAVELFVNGRPLSARVYPTSRQAQQVSLSSRSGTVTVDSLDAWKMRDVWHGPRSPWPGT